MNIHISQMAPDFVLSDQNGEVQSLANYRDFWILLYFYAGDNEVTSIQIANNLRDNSSELEKYSIKILGISADTIASHRDFALKYAIPFPILADDKRQVINLYGVWVKKHAGQQGDFMGVMEEAFLVNPLGYITKMYDNISTDSLSAEVLRDIEELSKDYEKTFIE